MSPLPQPLPYIPPSRARRVLRAFLATPAAWAGVCAALLIMACFETADPDRLQGPSTETIGLSGKARLPDNSPAAGARVVVRPAAFLADTQETPEPVPVGGETLVDSAGAWRLKALPPGPYAIELRAPDGTGALVLCTLRLAEGRTKAAPDARLGPPAVLRGRVEHPRAPGASVFVQVYGLDRIIRVTDPDGSWRLGGLPAGRHVLRLHSAAPVLGSRDLPPVEAAPGISLDLGTDTLDAFAVEKYRAWPHSRRILVRTGPAGAGVAGTVTDFPLLVRLDASTFPFDSAASGGADLRFEGKAGRRLPYEIESWDAAGRKAAVWVRVDTLQGGNDTQSIRILWGRKPSVDFSQGLSVFDSASGFHSVWHLGDRLDDAARAASRLIPAAMVAPQPGEGPTPKATGFDGTASFLHSEKEYAGPQTFTISAWVRPAGEGKVMGFENYPAPTPSLFDRHIWVTSDGSVHFGVFIQDPPVTAREFRKTISSPPGLIDGRWHLVTAVQSPAGGQALFLDGLLAARDSTVVHSAAFTGRWLLGNGNLGGWDPTPTNTHFRGDLDEARVAHVVHSPDWIKLAYETQKPGSTVLFFQSE